MAHKIKTALLFTTVLLTATQVAKCQSGHNPIFFYETLKEHLFEPARVADISGFSLKKKAGTLNFKEGKLYLLKPVAEKTVAAVFIGKGMFHLSLPNQIERAQALRFLKADSVAQPFTAAYLLFSDETAMELQQRLQFVQAKVPEHVSQLSKKVTQWMLKERGTNLFSRIVSDLTNDFSGGQGLFLAALEQSQERLNFHKYLIFTTDSRVRENVGLMQYFPHRAKKDFYTVNSFAAKNDNTDNHLAHRGQFAIRHYELDTKVQKNGKAEVRAVLHLTAISDRLQATPLTIFDEVKIDSVLSAQGDTLAFVKEKDEAGFTVFFNKKMAAGDTTEITVCYSGKILERINENYLLKQSLHWYPRSGYLNPATYQLTYRTPDKMQVLSVGKKIEERREGDIQVTRWKQETPVIGIAFAFGQFDSSQFDFSDLSIQVYSAKHRSKTIRESIAGDVMASLHFFQNMLGDFPYPHLQIIERPGQNSNSYPGAIFLTSVSFGDYLDGVMEPLRAHEMSHQWWGNLVGWQSYHDQWLSEGMAEYSGAMATQFILADDKKFFEVLAGWRSDLLEKGHIGISNGLRLFGFSLSALSRSDGLQAGPIWLGQRLGSKYPVDYYVNVYEKGAYVFHMLRTMLRDFKTGDDSRFLSMLKDFAHKFKGRRARTEDFEQIVTEHFQRDMHWFFKQWIYGTHVPTYVYDSKFVNSAEGYKAELKIEQKDVPTSFRAMIPVTISFKNLETETTLVEMTSQNKIVQFGPFSEKPQKLIFNDYHGVLARVKH